MTRRMEGSGRKDVGAAGDVFLEDVVLDGAAQLGDFHALPAGDGDVHGQQDGGGGVDGHAGGDFVQRDVAKQQRHVIQGGDGDADLADFAGGDGVVGIVADLGGEIEGDGEAGLPLVEQVAVAAGWIPGRRRSRHTGAWSRSGRGTCWAGRRGCRGIRRGSRGCA